jgi:hypothetical protein
MIYTKKNVIVNWNGTLYYQYNDVFFELEIQTVTIKYHSNHEKNIKNIKWSLIDYSLLYNNYTRIIQINFVFQRTIRIAYFITMKIN